jgi:DNA-binding transcriptional ArsR family regulator
MLTEWQRPGRSRSSPSPTVVRSSTRSSRVSSRPAVSKHLRVLRDAGLVAVRPDGQRRLYRLRPEPFMELDEWLEPYRRMWRSSLDKLEAHLTE